MVQDRAKPIFTMADQ